MVGGATFTVSLPRAWADKAGLKPSSQVYLLEQNDGSLIIYPKYVPLEKREITIVTSPDEGGTLLARKIIAAYLDGYNNLKVKSRGRLTYDQLKEVEDFVKRMSGLEVVEETPEFISINALVSATDFPVERGFQRAHLITSLMYQEAMNALKSNDIELAKSVILRDGDVDRIYFLVARQLRAAVSNPSLSKALGLDTLDAIDYLTAIKRVEDTADSIENVAKMVESLYVNKISIPQSLLDEVVTIGSESFKSYDAGVKSFLSKDPLLAERALSGRGEVEKMRCELEGKLAAQKQLLVLHLGVILINLRNVAYFGGDIAEAAINRSVRAKEVK
ncbi:MAG: phosphate uptake regulator PhoU [Candidatus Nezhaarchaeales archaeon]